MNLRRFLTGLLPALLVLPAPEPLRAHSSSGGAYQIVSGQLSQGGGSAAGGAYQVDAATVPAGGLSFSAAYQIAAGYPVGGVGGSGAGPAAFSAWQTAIFGGPLEQGAGAHEDPDGDGIFNLLEFAFNLPPLEAGRPLAGPGMTGGLPWIRVEILDGSASFTMEFISRKNAGLFLPEMSGELNQWQPSPTMVLEGPVSISGAYERTKLRIGPALSAGAGLFHRLRVLIQ